MEDPSRHDIGRPVRIVSISFANGKDLQEIVQVVDCEGSKSPDLIALPETWLGQRDHVPETLDGPVISAMAALAKKHRTYLDRGIYHEDFNLEKRARLLQECGDDVLLEKSLKREAWFVLKAKRAGVSARGLARQYGLEELRDYIDRSRREIDQLRS